MPPQDLADFDPPCTSMHWATFEFNYRLDVQRLTPHIAAMEAYNEAAFTRVLPLWWREQSGELNPIGTEDNPLSQPELSRPLGLLSRIEKQQLRIRRVSQARAWVRERFVPGSAPLSLEDILTMHRMLTAGYASAGILRTTPVEVGRWGVGGIHQGAPPEKLPRLLDQYIQFVNGKEPLSRHPVIHALSAHFFFVALHPFADGNGRVSRLLQAAILFQHGYNVHGGYALSNYFYENRDKYETLLYQCLQRCPFDLTPFVAFGMEGLLIELQAINSFLKTRLHRTVGRTKANRGSQIKEDQTPPPASNKPI